MPAQLRIATRLRYSSGEYERTVVFTNVAGRSCAIRGYPRVELLRASGTAVRAPTRRGGTPLFKDFGSFLVVLAPGEQASFSLGGRSPGALPGDRCQLSRILLVWLPQSKSSFTVRALQSACRSGILYNALIPFTVSSSGRSFTDVLAAHATVTFTWR